MTFYKSYLKISFLITLWILGSPRILKADPILDPDVIRDRYRQLRLERESVLANIYNELVVTQSRLDRSTSAEESLSLLLKLRQLESSALRNERDFELKYSLMRYKNGVQIIKLLYEKLLDLDHHFTSLNSYQDIHEITNLNSYPEFTLIKERMIESSSKKSSVILPEFLQSNFIVALGYTLLSSVFGESDKKDREKQIDEIACILDFTSSMFSDVKMIYYETEFLHSANKNLLERCQEFFEEYTAITGYNKSLSFCRTKDDWDQLTQRIVEVGDGPVLRNIMISPDEKKKHESMLDNLEFNIQRLVAFIEAYNTFITSGNQYYIKFRIIINGYQNQNICLARLPGKIKKIENNIELSIQKFSTAYQLPELKGSRLRELLFGSSTGL